MMKKLLFMSLVLLSLTRLDAQAPVEESPADYEEVLREAGFKPPRAKTTNLPGLIEEKALAYAEAQVEEVETGTGEKIEKATEEVGKALGPLGKLFQWLSDLPGYWEAFLVGGVCIVSLLILYSLIIFGVRRIMRRRGKPDWRLARRYAIFLRILFICISILIALVWIGETGGWFYNTVTAIVSISSAFLAINIFSYLILERRREKKRRKPLPVLFQQVIRGLLYLVAIIAVMGATTELDLSAVLASSAMLSLVLGLALQDTLGNVFAGMSIHASKPFEIGDWIAVKDFEGQVVQMNWREVRLRTFEGDYIILPNSVIASSDVYNYSRPTTRHIVDLEIGTSYQDPPEKVRRVIKKVIEDAEGIEPAEEHLFVTEYNDFSIDYTIRFYLNDYSKVRIVKAEVMNRLWYAFRRSGITIPFPIRNVYLRRTDRRALEEKADEDLAGRLDMFGGIELFAPLDPDVLAELARKFKPEMYACGEVVVEQGEAGDSFYVIGRGKLAVYVKKGTVGPRFGIKVAELEAGNFFGEMSLLTGEVRTATVIAVEECETYALGKDDFKEILQGHPEVSAQLATAVGDRVAQNLSLLSKYLTKEEQKTMGQEEKTDRIRRAILGQMRDFFGF